MSRYPGRNEVKVVAALIRFRNGLCLIESDLVRSDLDILRGRATSHIELEPKGDVATTIDARNLLVLPGLIDIHGDAFERQIMPRPAVTFPLPLALAETDRQLVANGITTAFHGLTWSWEPGFRGAESARAFLAALEGFRSAALVDHRLHLRQEVYNLDAESEIIDWIAAERIDLLAFNDHLTGTIKVRHRPEKMRDMVRRSGLTEAEFLQMVDRLASRDSDVAASIERLAAEASRADVRTLSHDDLTISDRARFRDLGANIAEFPVRECVAAAAIEAGDHTVFGAPNVLRGGSHTGCPSAAEMVLRGHCSILASDYYYPSLLQAPFVLADRHGVSLPQAWDLVSRTPAIATGLADRGALRQGMRGDVILVERRSPLDVHVVCVVSNGRVVHISDVERLQSASTR
ncbi:MAG: alpha-D-ribose 1-methylphosphonate 5-triphosphate diphosphatase [Beijerinckiaceae bacterium]